MRILLLVPEYPPDFLGGGAVVYEALRDQFAARNEVTVVAGTTGDPFQQSSDARLGVTRIAALPLPARLGFLKTVVPPTPSGARRLWRSVADADVVHAHGFGFPTVDIGIRIAVARKIPVVHTLHGFPVSQDKHGRGLRLAFAAYERLSGHPAVRRGTRHTAVSDAVAELYRERYSIDATTISNGVELPPEEHWPEFDDIAASGDVVIGVGRLEWIKGFDTLIRAVATIDPSDQPSIALIGADHGEERRLRKLAADQGLRERCHFMGRQSRGRVVYAYKRAATCVTCSHTEAFPAVPLEAMLSACPVIATALPGITSYAKDGHNALLFERRDHVRLAEHLQLLQRDHHLWQTLRTHGVETAEAFSWERVARRYEELFDDATRPSQ